ncbi:non-ribosomal peptide synthetase [Acidovorax sp. NCPPB 3576]|uniref:non-ribosomal peptide synthetase n=1 Tax=Acidovorax sp. NCPPB 3576 TaxID=2940488 RepID=UPI002349350E|nr:non-ribosomal peptide synthetase [Acidovorax sp. NCPPB 3576]WCM87221.1 amino acid adenylation domain-containing protein [Acidovorax sp. NCPPB 3576]
MSTLTDLAESTFALSPEQRALLSMADADPRAAALTLEIHVRIDGPLEPQRLRAAVEAAVRPHGALSTALQAVPGYRGLRQQSLESAPSLDWRDADLRPSAAGSVPAAALSTLKNWLQGLTDPPMDPARAAVLRVGLARTADAQHTLVIAASALSVDQGSLVSLLDQIARAYGGEIDPDLEEPFQYAQFVEWRQDLEGGDDAQQGKAYWRRQVEGGDALPPPRLQALMAGPAAVPRQRLALRRTLAIDPALAAQVQVAADSAGAQVHTLLQAVWWLQLSRLTEESRFMAGWQHDCRDDYDVMQGGVGAFCKVLPVKVDIAPQAGFMDWLRRLQSMLDAHVQVQEFFPIDAPPLSSHQRWGFLARSAPARHGVGSAVWQVDAMPAPLPCFELVLDAQWSAGQTALLGLHAVEGRCTEAAAQALLMQFTTLLAAVVKQPEAPVNRLSLAGAQERAFLLSLNDAVLDVGTLTVGEHIARWAELTPDAPAIEAGSQRLTYRELESRVDRMAQALHTHGLAAGGLLAIELPRSIDLVVAMLAAWRVGAGYLPLEPDWPDARRQAVLAHAQPACVLRAQVADGAPFTQPSWREVGLADLQSTAQAAAGRSRAPQMQDLAYVLYTSGSTGQPKGVVIGQAQLLNYVACATQAMDLGSCRRWALTSSVVADLGNTALFGALFNGACLVVAEQNQVEDAQAFAAFMAQHQIDAIKMVPSHLEALLEHESPVLPRTLVLGGEATPGALLERIGRLAPQCRIYNHYGPTETTVGVMVHAHEPGALLDGATLPLTRVLANLRVHVLDEHLQVVPQGGRGMVFIGGAQLCRGYLHLEAGSDVFIDDPFVPGERLYRTGDLAWRLPGGGIRLAGRADHQIKIRGFRVEPAEVEAALLSHPHVAQATVFARPGEGGAPELVAFVVASGHAPPTSAALRDHVAARLPSAMVPARCVVLAQFPRLPNGKIDRVALESLAANEGVGTPSRPPRDALEHVLAEAMAQLLQRDAIGVDDDFFDLGAHSLLVIKLVARIRKLLQLEVAPGLVFDHPSISALAAALRQGEGDRAAQLEQRAQAQRAAGAAAVHAVPPGGEGENTPATVHA